MRQKRADQDPLHRASRTRLGEVDTMKRECVYTRNLLRRYVRGHVFALQKIKINRHLKTCVVCRSELEGIRREEETRQILKYIDVSEGILHHLGRWIAAFGKLRKLVYRPLWTAGAVAILAAGFYFAISYYATMPRKLDQEIDRIVKTAPTGSAAVQAAAPSSAPSRTQPATASAPALEPLVVTIIPGDNTSAVNRINGVMRGNTGFRQQHFSESSRELTGSMPAGDLLAFFDRIGPSAEVRFNRKRLDSFPAGQAVPFVLKLKAAPPSPEKAAAPAVQQPLTAPPATAPTITTTPAAQ